MIAECRYCRSLVNYKKSSDLLDGHHCPERIAAESKSRPRSVGGPIEDEVWSESQMERESLDNSAPPETPEETELAAVDYRLRHCQLCAGPLSQPWDETTPLICLNCGAIVGTGGAA